MADQEFRVQVLRNDPNGVGDFVVVSRGTSLGKLKKLAGKRLGLKAKRVFLANGTEVQHIDEIGVDEMLYFTQGEPFFRNAGVQTGQETLNVSVLGAGGVGKSAITLRFVRDFFAKNWDPTIEDAYRKTVDVDDKLCTLEILDTAGQDDFQSLRAQWMSDKDGYIFVYSMVDRKTFEDLKPFFELHRQINAVKRVPIVLVANKKDKVIKNPSSRKVTREMGMMKAQQVGALYMETSACTGENVHEVFEHLVREVRRQRQPLKQPKGILNKCCII